MFKCTWNTENKICVAALSSAKYTWRLNEASRGGRWELNSLELSAKQLWLHAGGLLTVHSEMPYTYWTIGSCTTPTAVCDWTVAGAMATFCPSWCSVHCCANTLKSRLACTVLGSLWGNSVLQLWMELSADAPRAPGVIAPIVAEQAASCTYCGQSKNSVTFKT